LTREFLGQRLVNAKLITQGQLLRILDEQKKSGTKRLGDLLVEKGILSKDLLDTFIKEQIQDAIFNLLQWDMGKFTFDEGVVSPQEIGLSVSVENLIMESSRRLEEWEVIQRKIPNLDVIVRMAPTPPEDAMEINIKPEEWTLLVLADGIRTVRDIGAATERSEFEACKIIYGLVTAGLLEVSAGRFPPSTEEPSRMSPADLDDLVVSHAEIREPETSPAVASSVQEAASDPLVIPEPVDPEELAEEVPMHVEATQLEAEPEPQVAPDLPPPVPAMAERSSGGNGSHHELAAPPQATSSSASMSKPGTPAEAGITKETLLRLIAGVRNL
ncbi:MAG TPA: DUF4388 domain-containing protein, partial [Actinomycetota bacterium]|nr:DUF4388 domain-containing protein [Actinomycetota bacterium]